tara:strand:- start:2226 stop:2501 length:276 start_codon:yes stop_codon:yes gene_type:complete
MLHFPPLGIRRLIPSKLRCEGLNLSKKGFNIWEQIASVKERDIINIVRANFPLDPEKNPNINMRTTIGIIQLFLFVMNGIKISNKALEKYL